MPFAITLGQAPVHAIAHQVSRPKADPTPAQSPTGLPLPICICPKKAPVPQTCPPLTKLSYPPFGGHRTAPGTKTQAANHSAPFTARHRNATGKQPKGRRRHTQKAPTTVRCCSKSCNHCWHPCRAYTGAAEPSALAESTRQSRRRIQLHSIP